MHVIAPVPYPLLTGTRCSARTGGCEPETLGMGAGTTHVHPTERQDQCCCSDARRTPLVVRHRFTHSVQFIREFGELGVDYRGEQLRLIAEVAVGGTGGDAERARRLPQAECSSAAVIDTSGGLAK